MIHALKKIRAIIFSLNRVGVGIALSLGLFLFVLSFHNELLLFYNTWRTHTETPLAKFNGEFEEGSLIIAKLNSNIGIVKVYIDGREIRISRKGNFVFAISIGQRHRIAIKYEFADKSYIRKLYDVKPSYYPLQIINIKKPIKLKGSKIVTSEAGVKKYEYSKEVKKRVKKEIEDISYVWKRNSNFDGFSGTWRWPLLGRITSRFGSRRVVNQVPMSYHFGIDIVPTFSKVIYAPAKGVVSYAGIGRYFAGNMVVIDHGHGVASGYFHMDKISVKKGEKIKQGQRIGSVGKSGFASGEHLHWLVGWFDIAVNPEKLAGTMPKLK